jgi:triacylglycerol lipase
VLSITTIATPHRGSSFADHFLATVGRTRMPSVLSLLDRLPNGGGDGKAFESLTIESMRKFNDETPDDPSVRYFSWGATYDPGIIDTWKWPHSVVLEHEGENDGLVSVASSKWVRVSRSSDTDLCSFLFRERISARCKACPT